MTKQEFDNLAERVLLAAVSASPSSTAQFLGQQAVKIADEFVKALNARYTSLAKETNSLMPEEIRLIQDGNVIGAIRLVRERTGMNLKESKDLVDKIRTNLKL